MLGMIAGILSATVIMLITTLPPAFLIVVGTSLLFPPPLTLLQAAGVWLVASGARFLYGMITAK